MIFYFSGTGNSQFVAQSLLRKDEQLINIADLLKGANDLENKKMVFTIAENENVGFVFPVYFYTVPSFVKNFIKKIKLKGAKYIYCVITCGGGIGQAGHVFARCLREQGMELNLVREVLMPDNSMLFYQIPGTDRAQDRLDNAKERCKEIKKEIISRTSMKKISGMAPISDLLEIGYKSCQRTKKFYAKDNCVGCGLCEKNCPESVIKLTDGKPVWTKKKCCKCSACINRCPVAAIEYGKHTVKRNRYVNPQI